MYAIALRKPPPPTSGNGAQNAKAQKLFPRRSMDGPDIGVALGVAGMPGGTFSRGGG